MRSFIFGSLALATGSSALDIVVSSSGGNATSGHQYGFLHEDISNSGDGGVYAELVRNRAFQNTTAFPASLDGWTAVGEGTVLSLDGEGPPLSDALDVSVTVKPGDSGSVSAAGLSNDGYWGIQVTHGQVYTGSFWVYGGYDGVFTASLQSALVDDEVFASVEVDSLAQEDEWVKHTFELVPDVDAPSSNNTFTLTFDPSGLTGDSLNLNLISLFPPTYKGRANGLRIDLADALKALNPSVIRLPGGNMLEGLTGKTWWDWKNTLGDLEGRPGFDGVWGYQQTNGLGLLEYLLWAEDMDLEIVVGVYAGLALNGDIVSEADYQPIIDDALAEIEFVIGANTTKWGAVRASLGHAEPFPLRYVEVGNEDWLNGGWDSYKAYRFPLMFSAIRDAYPDLTVISSGATTNGYEDIPAGAVGDYHAYLLPDNLVTGFNLFDNNDVPHIVGEVAATAPNGVTTSPTDGNAMMPFPWWIGSVAEAVSLIGYERNADRLIATFYAPVLRSLDRSQWPATILSFAADHSLTTASTSAYVWSLFAAHPISHTLPVQDPVFDPAFYVAGTQNATGSRILKAAVYNTTDHAPVPFSVVFDGLEAGTKAQLTLLTADDPYAFNDPFTGENVVNTNTSILEAGSDGAFTFELPELSVAVLDTDYS